MKVLRVISSMNPDNGGPCQGIRNAIPELAKLGIVNEVVCLDHPDDQFIRDDYFKVFALGPAKTAWCYSPKLIPWLLENLSRFDAVIVHGLWQFHGYAVNSAINKLKKSGNISIPKYFVMPHGMLDPYFQKDPERKLKAIRNILYWKVIESKNINNATGVLFTCETELFLAKKTFKGYFPKKELNVGYGIKPPPLMGLDMRNALLKICPGVENKSYVLFLSRIHPKKGVDLLIKAYNELSISGNLPLLIIAGPGMESNYGRYLTQMVKKHPHLINKIFFTGMLSGNEKWGAFYGCDAFILPSHQENFGISVVEAMACGKPVLISNQVNIYVEIEASEAGIIADDTLEGTKLMLSEWLGKSKDNQIKMGLNAEQLFRENYTFSEVANRFYSAINN